MMDLASLPVAWANYLSMLGFALLAVLVWLIPGHRIYQEARDEAGWRDIRVWASVLIAVQLALYALFT